MSLITKEMASPSRGETSHLFLFFPQHPERGLFVPKLFVDLVQDFLRMWGRGNLVQRMENTGRNLGSDLLNLSSLDVCVVMLVSIVREMLTSYQFRGLGGHKGTWPRLCPPGLLKWSIYNSVRCAVFLSIPAVFILSASKNQSPSTLEPASRRLTGIESWAWRIVRKGGDCRGWLEEYWDLGLEIRWNLEGMQLWDILADGQSKQRKWFLQSWIWSPVNRWEMGLGLALCSEAWGQAFSNSRI